MKNNSKNKNIRDQWKYKIKKDIGEKNKIKYKKEKKEEK